MHVSFYEAVETLVLWVFLHEFEFDLYTNVMVQTYDHKILLTWNILKKIYESKYNQTIDIINQIERLGWKYKGTVFTNTLMKLFL